MMADRVPARTSRIWATEQAMATPISRPVRSRPPGPPPRRPHAGVAADRRGPGRPSSGAGSASAAVPSRSPASASTGEKASSAAATIAATSTASRTSAVAIQPPTRPGTPALTAPANRRHLDDHAEIRPSHRQQQHHRGQQEMRGARVRATTPVTGQQQPPPSAANGQRESADQRTGAGVADGSCQDHSGQQQDKGDREQRPGRPVPGEPSRRMMTSATNAATAAAPGPSSGCARGPRRAEPTRPGGDGVHQVVVLEFRPLDAGGNQVQYLAVPDPVGAQRAARGRAAFRRPVAAPSRRRRRRRPRDARRPCVSRPGRISATAACSGSARSSRRCGAATVTRTRPVMFIATSSCPLVVKPFVQPVAGRHPRRAGRQVPDTAATSPWRGRTSLGRNLVPVRSDPGQPGGVSPYDD